MIKIRVLDPDSLNPGTDPVPKLVLLALIKNVFSSVKKEEKFQRSFYFYVPLPYIMHLINSCLFSKEP